MSFTRSSRSALVAAALAALAQAPLHAADAPPAAKAKPQVQGFAAQRVEERLSRGLLALPIANNRVYIGWRLLANDPKDIAFHVYRRSGGAQAVRLTDQPLSKTTDFVDANPPQGQHEYFVRAVVGGQEGSESQVASAAPSAEGRSYVSLKLDGDHTFQKAAIADLDGDGRYDFVLKQPNGNVDPYEKYWKKSPGTYKLEAYRHDGTFLWRHDLGWSIEQGIWYSPYIVYDFDGDGRAEVAVKTGQGDPRDPDGRVTTGPEYLSILDGQSGKEITKVDWPSREGFPSYNYYCRNQLGIAYLDGKTPALIVERGTYNTIKLVAYEFHNARLRELWRWQDKDETQRYTGQGAHCIRAADIDEDGRDEVIIGSGVIDDNGVGLWTTRMGHPDHVTVGDLDPDHPGLEIHYGMETKQQRNGMCMVDARTGKLLWGYDKPTRHVHGQGLVADLDPRHPGTECYSADTDPQKDFAYAVLFNARGQIIGNENLGGFAPRAAYWDADVQRELLMGKKFRDFESGQSHPTPIDGAVIAVADILGDWREEIITTVAGELRIYTTSIPATDRRPCLMQDPIYRLDVAVDSQGYLQIPAFKVLPAR